MLHRLLSYHVFFSGMSDLFLSTRSCRHRQRKIVTLSMPNSETGSSVSDIDVPNRSKTKGMLSIEKGQWLIKKSTEEVEYPSLDGGHSLVKETKVTVRVLSIPCYTAFNCAHLFHPCRFLRLMESTSSPIMKTSRARMMRMKMFQLMVLGRLI